MAHPLDDAKAKIGRASKHIDELTAEIESFLKTDPYLTVGEPQRDGRTHWFRISNHPPDAPIKRWGIILGDVVHNLRSALDHIAWQLAIKHSRTPPEGTEFPVFLDARTYFPLDKNGNRILTKKGEPVRGSGPFKMRGLDGKAQALIESLQPFNRPHGNLEPVFQPLWTVHNLNIRDKHRVIPVVTAVQESVDVSFTLGPGGTQPNRFRLVSYPNLLKHKALIAQVILPVPDPEVKVNAKFSFTVVPGEGFAGLMGKPKPIPVLQFPRFIPLFEAIVTQFEPFFS